MPGRHKAGTPDSIATRWLTITVEQDHEPRQVVIFVSQSVIHPGTQTWASPQDAPRVHLCDATHMVQRIRLARPDDTQIIGAFSDERIPV